MVMSILLRSKTVIKPTLPRLYLVLYSAHQRHRVGVMINIVTFSPRVIVKGGGLIMTGGIKVLEYSNFEKNIITLDSRNSVDYITCVYIGEQRKNRKK